MFGQFLGLSRFISVVIVFFLFCTKCFGEDYITHSRSGSVNFFYEPKKVVMDFMLSLSHNKYFLNDLNSQNYEDCSSLIHCLKGKYQRDSQNYEEACLEFRESLKHNDSWLKKNRSLVYFEYGHALFLNENLIDALAKFTEALQFKDEWINEYRSDVQNVREMVFNELNPKPPLCSCLDYSNNPSSGTKVYGYMDACNAYCCNDKNNSGKYHAAKLGQITKGCNQ